MDEKLWRLLNNYVFPEPIQTAIRDGQYVRAVGALMARRDHVPDFLLELANEQLQAKALPGYTVTVDRYLGRFRIAWRRDGTT